MDTDRQAALLEELFTISIWDALCADADDHDGAGARQRRLEEIARELNPGMGRASERLGNRTR
jgi:hypothetical protein